MKPGIALITGASSGIGMACAHKLASLGYHLLLAGRRGDRLTALANELQGTTNVFPVVFDIRNFGEVSDAWNELPDAWKQVDVLVNNAGLALGLNPIQAGEPDDWDAMIDTNLKGLLYISRLVTPGMTLRKSGHVVNIGSIAGKEAYANGNVYCATKFAVDGLTRAMRIDLLPYGIRVSAIHPGMVETEFSEVRFKGDKDRAKQFYLGLKPLSGSDVAEALAWVISCPAHVNISDLVITPTAQASIHHTLREP
jgi:3-hydroxy acid dehydrogenase/malonic semialdehyde reductase